MKNEKFNPDKVKLYVTTLVKEQKAKIEQFHNEQLKEAAKLGEQDGMLNLPTTDDELVSPNEGLIKNQYQKLIADSWNKGRPYLDAPHLEYRVSLEKIADLDKNHATVFQREMEIIGQRKNDEMVHLEQEFALKEEEIKDYDKLVQRDYLMHKNQLAIVQEKTGRGSPLIHFKSKFWYIVLLLGIGLSEVPLNLQIFQKFGEAFFITIIMACSLAISIPVLAHFTGVFLKQRKEKREYWVLLSFCLVLFIIFNFGVSIFRAYALADNLGEIVNDLNIIIFTSLNLILFIIGVLASYFRHDESYELEHHYTLFIEEKKRYDAEKLIILNKMQAIKAEKNERVKTINIAYVNAKEQLNNRREALLESRNTAIIIYDELLNAFVALEAEIEASYRIAVEKYRAANLMHRNNHRSPKSWSMGIAKLGLKFSGMAELDPN